MVATTNSNGDLNHAAFNNNIQLAQELLEKGTNPNIRIQWTSSVPSSEGESDVYEAVPLCLATIAGHLDMVNLLLKHGALVDFKDSRGRTPVICAIFGNIDTMKITPENYDAITQDLTLHQDIIRSLASHVAPFVDTFSRVINLPQEGPFLKGITPLCLTAYLGKAGIIKALVEENADVDGLDRNGATALMYAARDGHSDVVKILLKHHAQHHIKDVNGWTAIQYGQAYPEIEAILEEAAIKSSGVANLLPQDLLQDISRKYPQFYNNLSDFLAQYSKAERKGETLPPRPNSQSVSVIIASPHRSNVYSVDESGLGHSQIFSQTGDSPARLYSIGTAADEKSQQNILDPTNQGSTTPVQVDKSKLPPKPKDALQSKQVKVLVAIKDHDFNSLQAFHEKVPNFDFNFTDPTSGLTPLQYATRIRPLKHETGLNIKFLIHNGAKVNAKNDRSGKTPLHYIVRDSITSNTPKSSLVYKIVMSTIYSLIEARADPNISDVDGNYPIHYASKSNCIKLTETLLKIGSKLDVKNKAGELPIDLCTDQKMKDFLKSFDGTTTRNAKPERSTLAPEAVVPSDDFDIDNFYEKIVEVSAEIDRMTTVFGENEDAKSLESAKTEPTVTEIVTPDRDDSLWNENIELKETITNLYDEIHRLMDEQEEASSQLDKTLAILDNLTEKYETTTSRMEKRLYETGQKLKVTKLALQSSDRAYDNLLSSIESDEEERKSLDVIVDLQAKRIKELEQTLAKKTAVIDELAKNVEEMNLVADEEDLKFVTPRQSYLPSFHSGSETSDKRKSTLELAILQANRRSIKENLSQNRQAISQISSWRNSSLMSSRNSTSHHPRDSRMIDAKKHSQIAALSAKEADLLREQERLFKEDRIISGQIDSLKSSTVKEPSNTDSQPDDSFVILEDLLHRLQPEKANNRLTLINDVLSSDEPSPRMSLLISPDQPACEVDPSLLGKLLHASKSRINHLKTTLVSLRLSNESLQAELEDSNTNLSDTCALLRIANKKASETEAKNSRLNSEKKKAEQRIVQLDKKAKEVNLERLSELEALYETAQFVAGPEDNSERGLISQLEKAINEVDKRMLEKVTHAIEQRESSLDKNESFSSSVSPISEDDDIHQSFESFIEVINHSIKKASKQVDIIDKVLVNMKDENSKYVKEIVRMKNAQMLKSFISDVKTADQEANMATSAISRSQTVCREAEQIMSGGDDDQVNATFGADDEGHGVHNNDNNNKKSSIGESPKMVDIERLSRAPSSPLRHPGNFFSTPPPPPFKTSSNKTIDQASEKVQGLLDSLQRVRSDIAKIENTGDKLNDETTKNLMIAKQLEYKSIVKNIMSSMKHMSTSNTETAKLINTSHTTTTTTLDQSFSIISPITGKTSIDFLDISEIKEGDNTAVDSNKEVKLSSSSESSSSESIHNNTAATTEYEYKSSVEGGDTVVKTKEHLKKVLSLKRSGILGEQFEDVDKSFVGDLEIVDDDCNDGDKKYNNNTSKRDKMTTTSSDDKSPLKKMPSSNLMNTLKRMNTSINNLKTVLRKGN